LIANPSQFRAPYDLWQKAADAKTGGRVRATRNAIAHQKDALGPSFFATPKSSSTRLSSGPENPKQGRKGLVPTSQNGSSAKAQKRKSDKAFAALADGHDFVASRSPRIKLKYQIPDPLITHPLHIPPPKQYDSLNAYLDSFIQLDDNEDITIEKAQARATHEATIRDRIAAARARGWLTDDNPAAPRKQPEPQNIPTRHDVLLKHVLNFSSLMAQERRANILRAKKISQMITQHFKKLEGTDEKEIKAEGKRIRRLAKQTAQEVRKKWKLAEKVFMIPDFLTIGCKTKTSCDCC
jgi:helicase SWR1